MRAVLKTKRHVYFVQSPLQAVNAHEARTAIADGEAGHHIVVFEQKEERNNIILANTLRVLGWEAWRTVPYRPRNAGKMWEWIRLRAALGGLSGVSRCYIGNYAAGMAVAAANLFPDAEHYLLDDGTSTINFPAFRYEGLRPEHLPAARSVLWLDYNTSLPGELTFFSIYEPGVRSPDKVRPNRLTFLQNRLQFDPQGPVFFIGSCLPDVDVISYEQFFQLFRAARQWLGEREIIYFPHRRELLDRKRNFFHEIGVRIAQPALPFELELVEGSIKPSLIATFYSTALDTLRIIGQGQRGSLLAFRVPEEWVNTDAHRNIARESYAEYLESAEIEVIDCLDNRAVLNTSTVSA
jgi:hypothetical protein